MQIANIMHRQVELVDPGTSIRDAATRMRDNDIGALLVGENDRLSGMVTDRDIAVRGVAAGMSEDATVRDVMSQGVVYCFEDDGVDGAAEKMAQHQVRRMPVLNRDKRMVGIVSLADLARLEAEDPEAAKHALSGLAEQNSEPRRL